MGGLSFFSWADYRFFMGGLSWVHGRIIGESSAIFVNSERVSVFCIIFDKKSEFHQKLALFGEIWRRDRSPATRLENFAVSRESFVDLRKFR